MLFFAPHKLRHTFLKKLTDKHGVYFAQEMVLEIEFKDLSILKWFRLIGKSVVEAEQKGEARAQYGSYLLKELSERLTKKYSRGFGISTLKDIRKFYLIYSDTEISHALRGQSTQEKQMNPNLGWIHYRALMRVDRTEARQFYTIESVNYR